MNSGLKTNLLTPNLVESTMKYFRIHFWAPEMFSGGKSHFDICAVLDKMVAIGNLGRFMAERESPSGKARVN